MSEAKREVIKMIRAKQDKLRHARNKQIRHEDVYNIVVDFVKDMDKAVNNSVTFFDFDGYLDEAGRKLNTGITKLDPGAEISIAWNGADDDLSLKWSELQVDHVKIIWSDKFLNKSTRSKEEVIDIGHLFLEGYFN